MIVDRAKAEDARDIVEVFYWSWITTYPNEAYGITHDDIEESFKERNNPDRIKKRAERYGNPPANEPWLVMRLQGKVIGLCTPNFKVDRNQLQRIYVLPSWQGCGIGSTLWTEARKLCDSTKDTYVEVAAYNERAIRFYRKHGFKPTNRIWFEESYKFKSGSAMPQIEMVLKAGH